MRKLKKSLAICMMGFMLVGLLGSGLFKTGLKVHAENPYMPLWEHIPDGEPYVFEDPDNPGHYRVYLYGSHDTKKTAYCGVDQVVWSAPVENLSDWRCDGKIFESIVNGAADTLYAPCVAEVKDADGKKTYYLYPNNQAGGRQSMIAKSDSPKGPFTVCNWRSGSTTQTVGPIGFDPGVLVDDDGRVYAYWGFQSSNAAELDPSTMSTIKSGTSQINNMIPSWQANDGNDFRFFEASSPRKVGNKYVFVYSRYTKDGEYGLGASNCTLAYAYSDSPLGPWTYGDTIVDARGVVTGQNGQPATSNPAGNTHGSIIQINGQWYVFYHRMINTDQYSRQAMVAPINVKVTEDGKVVITGIDKSGGDYSVGDSTVGFYKGAEVTSEGFELNGLNPYKQYSTGISSYLTGGCYIKATYDQNADEAPVINIKNNSTVGFKYFNFDGKPSEGYSTQLELNLTPTGTNGTIDIMMDSPWESQGGIKLGTVAISANDPKQAITKKVPVPKLDEVDGKHAVYFVFNSTSSSEICQFNDLKFSTFNTNAVLSSLQVNGTPVSGFSSTGFDYSILTPAGKVPEVTATAGDPNAKVEIAQAQGLPGQATVTVTIGSDQTVYNIYFTVDTSLSNLQVNGTTVTGFSPAGYTYNMKALAGKIPEVTAAANDPGAAVTITQATEIPGRATVTVAIGSAQTIYTINFTVDTSLTSLKVNGKQPAAFNPTGYTYTLKLPAGMTEIPQVTATANDPGAAVTITQASALPGQATVTVAVGSAQSVYTVKLGYGAGESDEFDSAELASQWHWVRQDPATWSLTSNPGYMTLSPREGDIYGGSNTSKNILLQNAFGDWTIETKLNCSIRPHAAYQQGGLIVYQNDDKYLKLDWEASSSTTTSIQVLKESNGNPTSASSLSGDVISSSTNAVWFRIAKSGNKYTCYYSTDGTNFTRIGSTSITLDNIQVGLYTLNGGGSTSTDLNILFDYFHFTSTSEVVNSVPVLNPIEDKSVDENRTLAFAVEGTDFDGDNLTYSTGELPRGASFDADTRQFTWTPDYTQAGTYTVQFRVNDGFITTSKDVTITVNNVSVDQQITGLKGAVAGLDIVAGIKDSLTVKLDQVLKLLANTKADKSSEAIEVLKGFIGQANDLRDEGVLTEKQAAELVKAAEETILNITASR